MFPAHIVVKGHISISEDVPTHPLAEGLPRTSGGCGEREDPRIGLLKAGQPGMCRPESFGAPALLLGKLRRAVVVELVEQFAYLALPRQPAEKPHWNGHKRTHISVFPPFGFAYQEHAPL